MQNKTSIRLVRRWLQGGLTLLLEAIIWAACLHLVMPGGFKVASSCGLVLLGLLACAVATCFIPNNAYDRTARRDEVVGNAMKTGIGVGVLLLVFAQNLHGYVQATLLFCVVLTVGRLILNSWFIRYSLHHAEQSVIICSDETAWMQKALQQNTYGLKLSRLEEQTARQLEAFLVMHPATESVYLSPTSLPAKEQEDIAHVCRKAGLTLRILPWPLATMNVPTQNEWRGNIEVVSPARLPLQGLFNRMVKRLTDIVLSLMVLLTIFPVVYLIAFICIKRQSRGPVIIARRVCGLNGKTFHSLTFRIRHFEAAPSFFAGAGDPGYFPFGKLLSTSRLEFMPQFLCVLRGSMSIVGSQTIRPEHFAEYRRELRQYFIPDLHLKAGITTYHFPSQSEGSTKADVWYCRNWGFWLDMRIMLQRIGTLLSKSKAKSINYI